MGFFYSLRTNKIKKRGGKVEADGYTWSSNGKSNIVNTGTRMTRTSTSNNSSSSYKYNYNLSKVPFVPLGKNKNKSKSKSKRVLAVKKSLTRTRKCEKQKGDSLPGKSTSTSPKQYASASAPSEVEYYNDDDTNDATIISTGSADSYFDNFTISSGTTTSSDGQDDRRDDRQEMSRNNGHRDVPPPPPVTRQSPPDVQLYVNMNKSGVGVVPSSVKAKRAQPLREIRRTASELSKDYIHTFANQLSTLEEAISEEDDDMRELFQLDSWEEQDYNHITQRHSFHDFEDEELIRRRWAASLKLMNK